MKLLQKHLLEIAYGIHLDIASDGKPQAMTLYVNDYDDEKKQKIYALFESHHCSLPFKVIATKNAPHLERKLS